MKIRKETFLNFEIFSSRWTGVSVPLLVSVILCISIPRLADKSEISTEQDWRRSESQAHCTKYQYVHTKTQRFSSKKCDVESCRYVCFYVVLSQSEESSLRIVPEIFSHIFLQMNIHNKLIRLSRISTLSVHQMQKFMLQVSKQEDSNVYICQGVTPHALLPPPPPYLASPSS